MGIVNKGSSCVRCKSYIFEEDDVVYCPVCGAPHHRECYEALGHCALEQFHGTENEYKPPVIEEEKKETNNNYQKQNINNDNFFPNGGGFAFFDFLGGVSADYKFDENVDASDVKKFVVGNTHRYIPKFTTLNKKNKTSWNWAAFLFPAPWMFSRKMYKNGIITAVFSIIATLLSLPFTIATNNFVMSAASYFDYAKQIMEHLPEIGAPAIIIFLISFILNLSIRIICGIFSDYWYKNHTINTIKKIKSSIEEPDIKFRKLGGVNIFYFFIATMVLEYVPLIVMTFIK